MHTINGVTMTTDYFDNAVYENGELKMLLNEAGYVSFPDKKFHFYIKDHQGNVRVVADAEGNVEEVNDYYPFGGLMSSATANGFQPYKYNGKELDREAGLDLYDYGARFYDPAIGRWHVVDPMAEKYFPLSPYGYCAGNPIRYRDEEGKFINNIIGAVVGGIVDLGTQVAANLMTERGAFEGINWVSVGASTIEGAVTSGLSVGKTLGVKIGVAVAKNIANNAIDGKDIINENVAISSVTDVAEDVLFGGAGKVVGKGMKVITPKGIGQKIEKAGNRKMLSKGKATELIKSKYGNKIDNKTARKIATSKGGIVEKSKSVGNSIKNSIQNVSEGVTEDALKLKKQIDENELKKLEK